MLASRPSKPRISSLQNQEFPRGSSENFSCICNKFILSSPHKHAATCPYQQKKFSDRRSDNRIVRGIRENRRRNPSISAIPAIDALSMAYVTVQEIVLIYAEAPKRTAGRIDKEKREQISAHCNEEFG